MDAQPHHQPNREEFLVLPDHEPLGPAMLTAGAGTSERLTVEAMLRICAQGGDSARFYDTALAELLDVVACSAGMLLIYDTARRTAAPRARRGGPPALLRVDVAERIGLLVPDLLAGCVATRAAVLASREELARLTPLLEDAGVSGPLAVIAQPLLIEDDAAGALLVCAGGAHRALTPTDVTRLRLLSGAIALAVARDIAQTREVERIKADLVAALSHELRTPLTAIRGYTEVLADGDAGPLSDEQRGYVTIIEAAAQRLQRQVDDLVSLARMQRGGATLKPHTLRLSDALAEVLAEVNGCVGKRGITLLVNVPASLPAVRGDAGAVGEVLAHLLDNALKCTPRGGMITVRAATRGDVMEIAVANTGSYIPPHEREHLFTSFYRTVASNEAAMQGAGLGLSIVKGLVERLGGRVWIESAPEASTTVTFTLRLADVSSVMRLDSREQGA